ncbi:transglutaminaseTgpA domain-containing protein [Granulicoccus phenolivorans]|uniref:transglutaminaseTgpA domain-containing protein n=1 Tax=Granulicoccus phenolivorans TaxID=266854 RepID=UPI00041D249E|nr:transglutaminaseTgpA domain-containing protein [Granulicoccus phenolivorans]
MSLRLRTSDRLSLAVIIAVLLASVTLLPLTTDRSYLVFSSILVVALGVISLILRRFRLDSGLVLLIQAVFTAVFLFLVSGTFGGDGNIFSNFLGHYTEATDFLRSQAAPLPPNPGVTLLLVTAVAVVMLLTDVMVQAIERPVWAIAPLVTLFLVPALGLRDDINFWYFAAVAVGYLVILMAEGISLTDLWPRRIRRSSSERRGGAMIRILATTVGIPALIFTFVLGMITPTLNSDGWGLSKPKGNDGPLQLTDPTLDLRRNLNQPENRLVLSYTTDQPSGAYLRMASLPVINQNGWQLTGMQLNSGNNLPPAAGYQARPGDVTRKTQVEIKDFRSEYLPLPYAPTSFNAPGQWAWDRESLMVLSTASNRQDATRNLSYSVDSVDIRPDGAGLSQAAAGHPPDAQLTAPMPADIPNDIVDLAVKITADQQTPALKAAAIQEYLRSNTFTYSTEPLPGSGYQALQNFLFTDKKGYCEQFAASMALMARVVGIPSRVAVGFLPGEASGKTWNVSIRDMHAWPELYFEGYGWVRFEPTPAFAAPAWSVRGEAPPQSGAPTPSSNPSAQGEPTPQAPASETPAPPPAGPEVSNAPWARILATAAGLAIILGLLVTPMFVRMARRNSRLEAVGDPDDRVENAWREVRDSVVDLGENWPVGSPRVVGAHLAHDLNGTAAKAATTLSLMVERERFARSHTISADLAAIVGEIRHGLAANQDRSQRILATVMPRSLFVRES